MAKGGILIFARINSSRLPGKALLPLGGMPLIERVYRRARLTGSPVYLATSSEVDDDVLANWAFETNIPCFRGDKNNVLDRAVNAANFFELDYFARLCGDRPLFNIDEMTDAMTLMQDAWNNPLCPDLISNFHRQHRISGLMTEIIRTDTLEGVLKKGSLNDYYVEHVTAFFYAEPKEFKILTLPSSVEQRALTSYAIDTQDEYNRQKNVFDRNPSLSLSLNQFDSIYLGKEV